MYKERQDCVGRFDSKKDKDQIKSYIPENKLYFHERVV